MECGEPTDTHTICVLSEEKSVKLILFKPSWVRIVMIRELCLCLQLLLYCQLGCQQYHLVVT